MAGGEQLHSSTGAMASKQGPLHTSRSWPNSVTQLGLSRGEHSPHCALELLLAWWVLGTPQSLCSGHPIISHSLGHTQTPQLKPLAVPRARLASCITAVASLDEEDQGLHECECHHHLQEAR